MHALRTRTARVVLAAALATGIAGTAPVASALTPPHPGGAPTEIAQPGPGDPDPDGPVGPGDLTLPEADPDCHPFAASCDLVDRPADPGEPDDGDPSDEPVDEDLGIDADDTVVARPTFTG
jgi:hypothetical protein